MGPERVFDRPDGRNANAGLARRPGLGPRKHDLLSRLTGHERGLPLSPRYDDPARDLSASQTGHGDGHLHGWHVLWSGYWTVARWLSGRSLELACGVLYQLTEWSGGLSGSGPHLAGWWPTPAAFLRSLGPGDHDDLCGYPAVSR